MAPLLKKIREMGHPKKEKEWTEPEQYEDKYRKAREARDEKIKKETTPPRERSDDEDDADPFGRSTKKSREKYKDKSTEEYDDSWYYTEQKKKAKAK